jgi:hypothetical protein
MVHALGPSSSVQALPEQGLVSVRSISGGPLWTLPVSEALHLIRNSVACAVVRCRKIDTPGSAQFRYLKLTCPTSDAKRIRFRNARPTLSSKLISKRRQASGAKRWVPRLDRARPAGSCGGPPRFLAARTERCEGSSLEEVPFS